MTQLVAMAGDFLQQPNSFAVIEPAVLAGPSVRNWFAVEARIAGVDRSQRAIR